MKFDKADLKLTKIQTRARKASTSLVKKGGAHKDKSKFDKAKERQVSRHAKHGIYEADIVNNVRLSDHQKAVLATLLGRHEQKTALVDLTSSANEANKQNLTSALQQLQKMGMVNVSPDSSITVSQKGMQMMSSENLADQSGQLSPEGQKYVTMFSPENADKGTLDVDKEMSTSAFGEVPPAAGGPSPDMPTTELPFGNSPLGGEEDPNDPQAGGMVANNNKKPFGESISLLKRLIDESSFKALLRKFTKA